MDISRGKRHVRLRRVRVAALLFACLISTGAGSPCGRSSPHRAVDAGDDRTVVQGATVQLDGTSTGFVTYEWRFLSQPDGSNSQIQNANQLTGASFVADAVGTYVVELAGDPSSNQPDTDSVTIMAVAPGEDGGAGGAGGSGGTGTPECPDPNDRVTVADAYVRGGLNANTPYGEEPNLLVKGDLSLNFARKTYLVFDLSTLLMEYSFVDLVLTLEELGTATPIDLYGAVGDAGWNPMSSPSESEITWNNAPLNNAASPNLFLDGTGGARTPLTQGYDFGMPSVPMDVPEGTQYRIDVTAFVRSNEGRPITLMLAHSDVDTVSGPTFKSREASEDETCVAPFLHFRP